MKGEITLKEEVRECSICKKQLSLDEVHYIGFWRKGLYKDYVEVIPVCKDDLPRKRRITATISVLSEETEGNLKK